MEIDRDNVTPEDMVKVRKACPAFKGLNELQQAFVVQYCTAPAKETETTSARRAGYTDRAPSLRVSIGVSIAVQEFTVYNAHNSYAAAVRCLAKLVDAILAKVENGMDPEKLTKIEKEILESHAIRVAGPDPVAAKAPSPDATGADKPGDYATVYRLEMKTNVRPTQQIATKEPCTLADRALTLGGGGESSTNTKPRIEAGKTPESLTAAMIPSLQTALDKLPTIDAESKPSPQVAGQADGGIDPNSARLTAASRLLAKMG